MAKQEPEQWDQDLERQTVRKPNGQLERIVQQAVDAVSHVRVSQLSRRHLLGLGLTAAGVAAGVALERKFGITEHIAPNIDKKREREQRNALETHVRILQSRLDTEAATEKAATTLYTDGIRVKYANMATGIQNILPFDIVLTPGFDGNELVTYQMAHRFEPELNQFRGLTQVIGELRAKKGEQLSFSDLLTAWILVPARFDHEGVGNDGAGYGASIPTLSSSLGLQAADTFIHQVGVAGRKYDGKRIDAAGYTLAFASALDASHTMLLDSSMPKGSLRTNAARFVATALGTAAGLKR